MFIHSRIFNTRSTKREEEPKNDIQPAAPVGYRFLVDWRSTIVTRSSGMAPNGAGKAYGL
jgi:hypothetical protein